MYNLNNDKYNPPKPCNKSKKYIFSFAEKISSILIYEYKIPINDLLQKLGGRVHYLNLLDYDRTEDGSIEIYGENNFDIYLAHFTMPERDRFTIAHELGHYFLHSDQGSRDIPMKAKRYGSDRVEWECNWFASGLLMPTKKFKELYNENSEISYLSIRFGTSITATEIRVEIFKSNGF